MTKLLPYSPPRLAAVLTLLVAMTGCDLLKPKELGRSLGDVAARLIGALQPAAGAAEVSADAPAGYVAMKAKAQLDERHGNALLLVDEKEEIVVPIFVGNTEALSIKLRLAGERYQRPLTHDLLDKLLNRLGARFVRAQVDELRTRGEGGVFIGTVVVKDNTGRLLEVDSRPSDAIALAIGNGAPIFMAQKVIDTAGHRIDDIGKPGLGDAAKPPGDATPL